MNAQGFPRSSSSSTVEEATQSRFFGNAAAALLAGVAVGAVAGAWTLTPMLEARALGRVLIFGAYLCGLVALCIAIALWKVKWIARTLTPPTAAQPALSKRAMTFATALFMTTSFCMGITLAYSLPVGYAINDVMQDTTDDFASFAMLSERASPRRSGFTSCEASVAATDQFRPAGPFGAVAKKTLLLALTINDDATSPLPAVGPCYTEDELRTRIEELALFTKSIAAQQSRLPFGFGDGGVRLVNFVALEEADIAALRVQFPDRSSSN